MLWLSGLEGEHICSIWSTIYKSPGEQEFIDKMEIEIDPGIALHVYLSILNYWLTLLID